MVPSTLVASSTPRLSPRPTAQGGLVEFVEDRHGRHPQFPSQRSRQSQRRRSKHTSHRAVPPSRGRGAVSQSAHASKRQLFGMRAGCAGSLGLIWHRGKETATPMTARRARKSYYVNDALYRSPSTAQSSTPSTRRRRLRRPSVLGDAPKCERASITSRGVTCRWASARAVLSTTQGRKGLMRQRPARASPLPLLNGADRRGSAAPSTHRCEPSHPLRGGALVVNRGFSCHTGAWQCVRLHIGLCNAP